MKPTPFYTATGQKSPVHAKPSFLYLSLLLAALLFASCKKDDVAPPPADPTYHLNVSTTSVQAPAAAGSSSDVSIDANASWKITIPAGIDWVEVSKLSGGGNDVIQFRVTKENNTGAKRTATLTVALENGKAPAKQVTVEQDFTATSPLSLNWQKVLGGSGNDYGYSIIRTADGGYLLSGRTTSNNNGDVGATHGGIDMWVVKLDAGGAITWQKTYGGNADEYSVAAAATTDGYVLTGYTTSTSSGDVGQNHGNTDFWVVKINQAGVLQWQKTLGGNADDRPSAVAVTTEGKIAVTGYTTSNNNGDVGVNHGWEDLWVVVLDNAAGTVVWKKTLGGSGSEFGRALVAAPEGGLFVGGTASSSNNGDVGAGKGSSDMWVLRLDKDGAIVWKNNYGGTNIDELYSLAAGPNNTLVAAGSTKSNNNGDVGASKGGEDMWVVQLNAATGALAWQKVLGGNVADVAKGVLVRSNGTVVVAGYSYSHSSGDVEASHGSGDYWIVALNNTGTVVSKKLVGGDDEDLGSAIADSGEGAFVVAGSTMSKGTGDVGAPRGNSDVWVVKLSGQ